MDIEIILKKGYIYDDIVRDYIGEPVDKRRLRIFLKMVDMIILDNKKIYDSEGKPSDIVWLDIVSYDDTSISEFIHEKIKFGQKERCSIKINAGDLSVSLGDSVKEITAMYQNNTTKTLYADPPVTTQIETILVSLSS